MSISRKQALLYIIILFGVIVLIFKSKRWLTWLKNVDISILDEKRILIDELAETIIPRTDTPGAKDAKVGDFVIKMVAGGLSKFEQQTFVSGLEGIENYCVSKYQHLFSACAAAQRIQVLEHFEESEERSSFGLLLKIENKLFGRSFIRLLKWLVATGYCSSELGATQALAYDYIPGQYEGCVSLQTGQKAWAIN